MKTSLHQLIADPRLVALTFRQRLEPLEGRDVPLHPPTYPPENKTGTHRHDTPYTVNRTRDGGWLCELDSVQSQANRMEAAYTAALADVVPHHVVRAGRVERDLTALPHRIADAAIRASALGPRIREAFEAFAAGDAMPLARLAPTSLVYGAWDSRDTRVAIPRAVVSAIRAANVSVLTSSAQYSGAFTKSALGLTDSEWTRGGARAGFAPSPDINRPGGVLVHGEIVQSASVMLDLLRRYGAAPGADRLPAYLLDAGISAQAGSSPPGGRTTCARGARSLRARRARTVARGDRHRRAPGHRARDRGGARRASRCGPRVGRRRRGRARGRPHRACVRRGHRPRAIQENHEMGREKGAAS